MLPFARSQSRRQTLAALTQIFALPLILMAFLATFALGFACFTFAVTLTRALGCRNPLDRLWPHDLWRWCGWRCHHGWRGHGGLRLWLRLRLRLRPWLLRRAITLMAFMAFMAFTSVVWHHGGCCGCLRLRGHP
jgi:hypothetical protein